jgi:hypothetical protein
MDSDISNRWNEPGFPRGERSVAARAVDDRVLAVLAEAQRPLQTADIQRITGLSKTEGQTVCKRLWKAGQITRRVKVITVSVGSDRVKQRRAFWMSAGRQSRAFSG